MKIKTSYLLSFVFIAVLAVQFFIPITTKASLVDDLQIQINNRNQTIAALEKEIAQYEAQVSLTSKQAATLKNLISTLDTTKKKLDAQIALTQNQIAATQLSIEKLGSQIDTQKNIIDENSEALAETMRRINQTDDRTLLDSVLSGSNVSSFLNDIQNLSSLQGKVKDRILALQNLKADLQNKQDETQKNQKNLIGLRQDLSGQQKAVVYDTQEKSKLLAQTKSQEASYQKILAQKKALKDAVEKELNDYEAKLKIAIDPNSIPGAHAGVLAWPVGRVIITQYFGNTEFARAHAAVYNGVGHNGIDLGVSIGTKVMAALSGTVAGTGNTDTVCPGGSYGKWVLITHDNGLSTLYAHLSVISVNAGQRVSIGETIGLSGATGYATGPHLHFTVYASQGVEIINRQSKACGGSYRLPVAALSAYLDPLSYLPSLP